MVANGDMNNHGNQHPLRHHKHTSHPHHSNVTHHHRTLNMPASGGILAALSDNRTGFANMPETRPPILPKATSPAPPTGTPLGPQCDGIEMKYDIAPAVICALCCVFGILYCFFGYRFFKATMFMTGFIFGGLVTYLICLEENLLPLEGKIGASIAAGVLCGLITMLVQYVGLFMTGFNFGLLLAIACLIVLEQFLHPSTKWIPIGVMFGTGLVLALLILYFQKSLTILGTSLFGAALITGSMDYYIELHMMVNYVWERIKAEESQDICWFSWLIMGVWPLAFIVGAVAQWRLTSKGFDHHEVVHSRRHRKVNLKRVRQRDQRETQREAAREAQHSQRGREAPRPPRPGPEDQLTRYRHLYQIRRVNGDVISQSFIHNIQHKLSPGLRLLSEAQYHQTLAPPQHHAINPSAPATQGAAPTPSARMGQTRLPHS